MSGKAELEIEGLDEDDAFLVRGIIESARAYLGCGLLGVEVCGIGEAEAKSLNRQYRGRNKTATILSFSLPSTEPGGMAGQVLLCPPAVRREARKLGIPYRSWLAELAVHGFLHILGHQHGSEAGKGLMFSHQRAVLNMVGRQ